jgi:phenylacetate-CoA ligase
MPTARRVAGREPKWYRRPYHVAGPIRVHKFDLSVIAPCFNEELNVPEFARRVLATFEAGNLDGELLLVDDGSVDGTRAKIEALAREHPLVPGAARQRVVVGCYHAKNRGIAQAWKTGTAAARAPFVAVIDSDLQYQPQQLLRLRRELLEHSVDVVQGWRSPVGRERGARYNLSRGFNILLNATFGMDLRDNKSGFVICAKEVMTDLLDFHGSYYYWQSFIMVAAHAKGYSYKEVETLFENRRAGKSFLDDIAYRASARSFVDLANAAWEYRVQRRPADPSEQLLGRRSVPDHSDSAVAGRDRSASAPLASRARWQAYLAAFDLTHEVATRDAGHYHELFRRTQWLAPEDLRELQDEKLRRLVRHAYRNAPFYRDRMRAAGVRPEDVATQADLGLLPVLTRDDVRDNIYFDILSENHDREQMQRLVACGRGGEPLVVFASRAQLELRWALSVRTATWTGYRFGDPIARLWPRTSPEREAASLRERARALLGHEHLTPMLEMDDARLTRFARDVESRRYALVDGPAEVLAYAAGWLAREPRRLRARPGAALVSGQTLTSDMRRAITDGLGCEVFDEYGTGELGGVAAECEAHDGLHVLAEGFVVELVKDGRPAQPGEVGEVIVTDLASFGLPLIRLRTGDRAVAREPGKACSCGRGLPMIGAVSGRSSAIYTGADDRRVSGTFFSELFKDYDHSIRMARVEQRRPGELSLLLVRGGRYSDETEREITARVRRAVGPIEITVDVMSDVDEARRDGAHARNGSERGASAAVEG